MSMTTRQKQVLNNRHVKERNVILIKDSIFNKKFRDATETFGIDENPDLKFLRKSSNNIIDVRPVKHVKA